MFRLITQDVLIIRIAISHFRTVPILQDTHLIVHDLSPLRTCLFFRLSMGRAASLRSQETRSTVPMPSDRSIAEPLTQTSQINTSPNNAANNGVGEHEDTFADQAEHTQHDPEMEVQSHLDSTGVWLLAAQHLSRYTLPEYTAIHLMLTIRHSCCSTWGDRTAEFAFPLYL